MCLLVRSILAGLLVAVAGCGAAPSQPAAPSAAPSPQPSAPPAEPPLYGLPNRLRIGESVAVGPVAITLVELPSDSRCPSQINCAWPGEAEALVAITVAGRASGPHRLKLAGVNRLVDESRVTVDGYRVSFLRLEPYPEAPAPIAPADYLATLMIDELANPAYVPVEGAGFSGVIVPEEDAAALGMQAEGYWTPSDQDVRLFESGLVDFLRQAAPERSPDLWQKQAGSMRQYAGIVRDGRRLLYASFFCSTFDSSWRHRVLLVADGGDCFFQLTYSFERNGYDNLMVNGEA